MTWLEPSDPTSYLCVDINMTTALEYVKKLNQEQDEIHYTLTHLLGHAAAHGLYKMRRDVGRISFGRFRW